MSGVRNLSNAIANDPSFATQTKGVLTAKEAAQMVQKPSDSGGGKNSPNRKGNKG